MFYNNTKDLEKYINNIYSQLKPFADAYGIYQELNVCFSESIPLNYEGVYCFTDKKGYHYCCNERGEVTLNNITNSLFEITYWVVESSISDMAWNFKNKNKVSEQDCRRIVFHKKLELFEALGQNYKKRAEIDIDEILKIAPYNDIK